MTGLGGADTFRLALADSGLAAYDRITDFVIGTDRIDGPTAVSAANVKELGAVSALTQSSIATILSTTTFVANQAATFAFGTKTFLALNDAIAGFLSTSDGLVDITGYSRSLTNLEII